MKQREKSISASAKEFWRFLRDYFFPPPPVPYHFCDHCGEEFPIDFFETKDGAVIPREYRGIELTYLDTHGKPLGSSRSFVINARLCRLCAFLNPRLVGLAIAPGGIRFSWEDADGRRYEFAQFLKNLKKKKKTEN